MTHCRNQRNQHQDHSKHSNQSASIIQISRFLPMNKPIPYVDSPWKRQMLLLLFSQPKVYLIDPAHVDIQPDLLQLFSAWLTYLSSTSLISWKPEYSAWTLPYHDSIISASIHQPIWVLLIQSSYFIFSKLHLFLAWVLILPLSCPLWSWTSSFHASLGDPLFIYQTELGPILGCLCSF